MLVPVIAASIILWPQSPPVLPQQQPQSPKASIEGAVVRIGSGEPIAGVMIRLSRVDSPVATVGKPLDSSVESPPPRPLPSATSDRQGKFLLRDLDAGSYRITAARNGYAKQEYGQRVIGGQGTVIQVAEGQALKDVAFRLTPTGNISGQVRDFAGEPLTGFQVLLLRSSYNGNGQRAFQAIGSARTDDRGEYRFYWITPGRYYLSAGFGNGPYELSGLRNPNEVVGKPYPTTYYPGTTDPSKASVIDVPAGADAIAIDFVLPQQELYRIRGKVIDATTGRPPRSVELRIVLRQPVGPSNVPEAVPNYSPTIGTFELRDMAPGSYWLFATTSPDPDTPIAPSTSARTISDLFETLLFSRPVAQAAVDISGSDVENLVLTLTPGVSIQGHLSVEGQDLSTITDFEGFQVSLTPTTPNMYEQLPRPMPPDGAFSLNNVLRGEYRVTVSSPQPEFYVKETRLDSVDVLNQPLLVSGAISGTLDIVLSSKAGQIEGTILNEQSQPVEGIQTVLIPDRLRDRIELYKTAVSDQNGHFTIRGITPGEYKIFAWEAIEEFAYFDLDFLRQSEQKGKPVSISESSKVTTEVKVIPAPQ
jgi:hypothetical protein